jgi:predicted N-formylglutamate amidohydrolase
LSPDGPGWQPTTVIVTCEHAGNEIPPEYEPLFAGAAPVLASHRGWDPGAMGYAIRVASRLSAPLVATRVSRLLVEVNRSPDHPEVFSRYTRDADRPTRQHLLDAYYTPHRRSVQTLITALIKAGQSVLHLGMHSFVDTLDGMERTVDIGLLFDPGRVSECAFINRWRPELERVLEAAGCSPALRVRMNEPYLGTDDGLTTHLRTVFPAAGYAGIEIEVRQGLVASEHQQQVIGDLLAASMPPVVRG